MPFDLTTFNISLINVLQATYLFTYHGSGSRFNFLAFSFLSSRYDHNNYNYYRIITLIYHCKTTSLASFLICPTEVSITIAVLHVPPIVFNASYK